MLGKIFYWPNSEITKVRENKKCISNYKIKVKGES